LNDQNIQAYKYAYDEKVGELKSKISANIAILVTLVERGKAQKDYVRTLGDVDAN